MAMPCVQAVHYKTQWRSHQYELHEAKKGLVLVYGMLAYHDSILLSADLELAQKA